LVAGHFGGEGPAMMRMIAEDKLEAYNFPQGVIATMPRNIAARRPGVLTKVGLYTFADPRVEGGKANNVTTEDLVEIVHFGGEEWMYYHLPKVDFALVRGNITDEHGNLVMSKDGIMAESLSVAQATRACGGKVFGEAELIVKHGTLHPKKVRIPGIMVDYLVQSKPENHLQTMGTYFNPAFAGDIRIPVEAMKPLPMSERKIIARRAAMELIPDTVINLGVGIPSSVSAVLAEEGTIDSFSMSIESGVVGGVPDSSLLDFAHAVNADAIIDHAQQFDFYDSGGVDLAILGLAEVDQEGNVNVSKFNGKYMGCGGFVNITQNTKNIIFVGTFTAGGLKVKCNDGKLTILQEGNIKKFKKNVEQITFSGKYAIEKEQKVLFVTERAVLQICEEGLELIEIAPGIDLELDILAHMEFVPIMKNVIQMPEGIFKKVWGDLYRIMKTSRENETAV